MWLILLRLIVRKIQYVLLHLLANHNCATCNHILNNPIIRAALISILFHLFVWTITFPVYFFSVPCSTLKSKSLLTVILYFSQVLYQQFKFFLNLYFLVVACSQFVPSLKIGYLYTYWAPLVMFFCSLPIVLKISIL